MFESSLIALLEADAELQLLLSELSGRPAIFSSAAPQEAELPYVVLDIRKTATLNLPVAAFDIDIDIYNRKLSGTETREIAERIEFVCDRTVISNDARFDTIRLSYEDGDEVENPNIDVRHYNCRLSARAGRKKWIEETISR